MFNTVRKEMPALTQAAWRREAARRMGVDYDTFLKAWKKPTTKPVVPPPVVVPDPPIKLPDLKVEPPAPAPVNPPVTYETTRAQFKLVKKENPALTDAEARRIAAERMGVDYDTYLKAWKRQKGGPATPPTPSPQTPTVTPTIQKQGGTIKFNKTSIDRYLKGKGFKRSVKTKARYDHRGNLYGGGISETPGYQISTIAGDDSMVFIDFRPGGMSPDEASRAVLNIMKALEDAGFKVEPGLTRMSLRVSQAPQARKVVTAYDDPSPAWKVKTTDSASALRSESDLSFINASAMITRGNAVRVQRNFVRVDAKNGETIGTIEARSDIPGIGNGFRINMNGDIRDQWLTGARQFKTYEEAKEKFIQVWTRQHEDVLEVNPGWGRVANTTSNCTSCASTMEMRARGYDVVAVQMRDGKTLSDVYRAWGATADDMITSPGATAYGGHPIGIKQWEWKTAAKSLPTGARGFINVMWDRGGAHIYNWEKRSDGRIWYLDGQSGQEWYAGEPGMEALDRANETIWILRTDQLEADPKRMGWLVSDRGQLPMRGVPKWVHSGDITHEMRAQ